MPSGLSPEQQGAIRGLSARILANRRFRDSARISAFLTFVLEKALAGQEDQIKETLIGIEVYHRGGDFDPQTDSIVRVEAGRLRSKLRDYFAEEGAAEPWRIELPKGTYVPVFRELTKPAADAPAETAATPALPVNRHSPASPPAAAPAKSRIWLIAAAAVVVPLAVWTASRALRPDNAAQVRRIAVLPFADLSESRDLEYFCEGLAEEVIDNLSRMEGLAVLARGSSFRFRASGHDAITIGRQLEVDRLLTGSVRRSGKTYRVTAQLVDTRTGVAVWSNQFDREAGNELRIQEDISREVARALQVTLTPRLASALAAINAEAYNLYLKGRYYYWKSTAEDEQRARRFFEEAIALAPDFAAAHAGLADSLASLPLRGLKADDATMARARASAVHAFTLDPRLLDSVLAKAHIARNVDYNWAEAERLYKSAAALHPGAARPHNSYGVLLSLMGRLDDADRELREALRLDPLSMQVQTNLTLNLYRQERYAEAVQQADRASAIDPVYRNVYSPKAAALAGLGLYDESLKTLEVLRERSGGLLADGHLGLKGYILARAGNREEALQVLAELERQSAERYVPRAAVADILLGLGEHDRALRLMREALANREVLLAGLLVSPHSRPVKNDPRFIRLCREVAIR